MRFFKRKGLLFLIPIAVMLLVFTNKLIEDQYSVNLIQYWQRSQPLNTQEIKWLGDHGPIMYGADQNSPPLRYVDPDTGQYKGFSVDMLQALSIELGAEIKFKPESFNDSLESLKTGETDIMDIFPSEQRAKDYLFSDPLYKIRGIILVPENSTSIASYRDLGDKRVAVVSGDYAVEFLDSRLGDINFIKTPDMESAIKLMVNGDADCVIGDEPVIIHFIGSLNYKDSTKIIDEPVYELNAVLALPKSEPELLTILNKGIMSIKNKHVTEKIQQKWFGISTPTTTSVISSKIAVYLWLGIFASILIFYALYFWNEKLKQEVRKRTGELFESKNDLETIFDGVTYFMVVVDRNYNILNANKAFCSYNNLQKPAVNGMNCRDFPALLYNGHVKTLTDETFSSGIEKNGELNMGDNVFEIGIFPLLDMNKNVAKVLMAIKDVTTLKINEKRMLQADKMAAVGQLAAGVAHEIRNPLGLIRNYAYLLKNHLAPDDERSQKSIKVIEGSVDRASSIISNLLNFSRISGEGSVRVNVREFLQEILSLEGKMLRQNNILAEIECEDISCMINQDSLRHIVLNLISNSIDAMPEGGRLRIECFLKHRKLHLVLSDTGTGINSGDLDNIFHPFFTTKEPGKGTGLGLYIAYNEVQKFGGEIKAESETGVGTTFKLILPIGDE